MRIITALYMYILLLTSIGLLVSCSSAGLRVRLPAAFIPASTSSPCIDELLIMPGVGYAFSATEVNALAQDPAVKVIISSGETKAPSGFTRSPLLRQVAPVLCMSDNTCAGLTVSQLTDLLTNATTDWSSVGGNAGAVHLYMHDGALQRKAAALVLASIGVSPGALRADRTYCADYAALEQAALADPGALVLGLKHIPDSASGTMKALPLADRAIPSKVYLPLNQRNDFTSAETTALEAYALQFNTYLAVRNSAGASVLEQQVRSIIESAIGSST
jgi:hypothetical protein